MWTPSLFTAKTLDFLKFMVYPYRQGGIEPVRAFFGQGWGVSFSRFYANVCYGRLLINFIYNKRDSY